MNRAAPSAVDDHIDLPRQLECLAVDAVELDVREPVGGCHLLRGGDDRPVLDRVHARRAGLRREAGQDAAAGPQVDDLVAVVHVPVDGVEVRVDTRAIREHVVVLRQVGEVVEVVQLVPHRSHMTVLPQLEQDAAEDPARAPPEVVHNVSLREVNQDVTVRRGRPARRRRGRPPAARTRLAGRTTAPRTSAETALQAVSTPRYSAVANRTEMKDEGDASTVRATATTTALSTWGATRGTGRSSGSSRASATRQAAVSATSAASVPIAAPRAPSAGSARAWRPARRRGPRR